MAREFKSVRPSLTYPRLGHGPDHGKIAFHWNGVKGTMRRWIMCILNRLLLLILCGLLFSALSPVAGQMSLLRLMTKDRETYREVKRVSRGTKVVVSFQWEWGRIYDAREMHKIKERSKVIGIFRPELDVVALTTYPFPFHASPAKLGLDHYFWIYHQYQMHRRGPPHGVGWPISGSGDEHEQQAFIRRLPGLLNRVNVPVIAWVLLQDVDLAEFDADLNTVGLVTSYGQRKIGYEAFKAL